MLHRFLIIDDSELDCYIAQKKIEHIGKENVEIVLYKQADSALQAIREQSYSLYAEGVNIILLDILMPVMDGYLFMEEFERLDEDVKNKYFVVAITSSMYKNQINKIYAYKSIKGVIEKPFAIDVLNDIIKQANPDYILE